MARQGRKQAPKAAAGKAAKPVAANSKKAARPKAPRDHLVDPDKFGKDPAALWKPLPPEPDITTALKPEEQPLLDEQLQRHRALEADRLAAIRQHWLMIGVRGTLLQDDNGKVLTVQRYEEIDVEDPEKMLRADVAQEMGITENQMVRHQSGGAAITLPQAELYGAIFGGLEPPRPLPAALIADPEEKDG